MESKTTTTLWYGQYKEQSEIAQEDFSKNLFFFDL